jgi:hypothetical protein
MYNTFSQAYIFPPVNLHVLLKYVQYLAKITTYHNVCLFTNVITYQNMNCAPIIVF